jgi:hypothetical protein
MKHETAVFANFTCKFGSDENLIDYLGEVVVPAFTDVDLKRTNSETSYYLLDVKIFELGIGKDSQPAIAGRFVKDTTLHRTQVVDKRRVVREPATMKSAPTSFFVLTIANHRLIYYAETQYAPGLKEFEVALRDFLTQKHKQFLRLDTTKRIATRPSLKIVAVAGKEEIAEFIRRYDTLTRLVVEVHPRNDETDASEMLESVNARREKIKAKDAKLTFSNPKGMDIEEASKTVSELGEQGNQTISTLGKDENGLKLVGQDTDFSITVPVENPPRGTVPRAEALNDRFEELSAAGTLTIPKPAQKMLARVRDILANLL